MIGPKIVGIFLIAILVPQASTQSAGTDLHAATQKPGIFVGKWQSEATRPENCFQSCRQDQ